MQAVCGLTYFKVFSQSTLFLIQHQRLQLSMDVHDNPYELWPTMLPSLA